MIIVHFKLYGLPNCKPKETYTIDFVQMNKASGSFNVTMRRGTETQVQSFVFLNFISCISLFIWIIILVHKRTIAELALSNKHSLTKKNKILLWLIESKGLPHDMTTSRLPLLPLWASYLETGRFRILDIKLNQYYVPWMTALQFQ